MEVKLYSIEEKIAAEETLKKGYVIPNVFCDERGLAQRLVNTGIEDPVILEINASGLPDAFRYAPHDEDELKSYMNDYISYRSISPIPASHVSMTKITEGNELGVRIYSDMQAMKENVRTLGDMEEWAEGMKKLVPLGISSEEHVSAEIQTAMSLAREGRFDELLDEDDFTKSVEALDDEYDDGLEY